jgi:hypothetical protein
VIACAVTEIAFNAIDKKIDNIIRNMGIFFVTNRVLIEK